MTTQTPLQPHIWQSEPLQVQRGDVWQLGKHRLMCGDSTNAEDVTRLLDGNACDLIFADPPYGIGIDDWDVVIPDVPAFIELITSHLKQGGFFAFTHQMPYMVDWLYALKHSRLRYKDHITWLKRIHSNAANPLLRTHESLFIYCKGKQDYYITKGRYTDIKLPGLMFDALSIDRIDRYISDLHLKLKRGYGSIANDSKQRHSAYAHTYVGIKMQSQDDMSCEYTNFTNVWSFLPEHHKSKTHERIKHPTKKPALLMNRLLELCTPENALVYDAFLGSGTTLISAENTNRRCVGMELSPGNCQAIIERWQEHTGQQAKRVGVE